MHDGPGRPFHLALRDHSLRGPRSIADPNLCMTKQVRESATKISVPVEQMGALGADRTWMAVGPFRT
jgi:hypothetical protein